MKSRKTLIVLHGFQRWFALTFVGYVITFFAIFGIALYFWFQILVHEMMNVAGLISDTFRTTLEKHLQLGLMITVGFVLTLILVAALQAYFFSRRIAGPLFSLNRHLEKCTEEGKLLPFRLRKGDLFMELADNFNKLRDKVGPS